MINQLINPSSGQPFLHNQIPEGLVNPVSQTILDLYPIPNHGLGFTDNNHNVNQPTNYNSNGFDIRGDLLNGFFQQPLFTGASHQSVVSAIQV
ncbi:MAG TPA: hypothetical protein VMW38_13235 [Terriglobia bacterium]|nr:hypothetical protein [Terriglobia bacterium]